MSRPARAEASSVPTTTKLSPSERERVEQAAKVCRQNLAEFVRDATLDRADQALSRDS